jgi:hypothetical protein
MPGINMKWGSARLWNAVFVTMIVVAFASIAYTWVRPQSDREAVMVAAFNLGQQAASGGAREVEARFDRLFHGDRQAHGAFMKGMMSVQNTPQSGG